MLLRKFIIYLMPVLLLGVFGCRRDATTRPVADVVEQTAQAFAGDDFALAENLTEGLLERPEAEAASPAELCSLALNALQYYERSGNDGAVPVALRLLDSAIAQNIDSVVVYMSGLPVEDMSKLYALLQISHAISLPEDFEYPNESLEEYEQDLLQPYDTTHDSE